MLNAERFPTSLWEEWWWVLWWALWDCCQGETFSQDLSNEHELHSTLTAKQPLIGTVIKGEFQWKRMLKSSSGEGRDSSTSPLAFPNGPSFHNPPSAKAMLRFCCTSGTSAQPHRAKGSFQTLSSCTAQYLPSHSPSVSQAELGSTHAELFIPKVLVISAH